MLSNNLQIKELTNICKQLRIEVDELKREIEKMKGLTK